MKYFTIIAAFIFMTSCVNQESNQSTDKEKIVVHEAQDNEVTLDNGDKWRANFATTKGILNMKTLIKTVNKDSNIDAYRVLGENLQKEFQHIFQRCDMTGEAHNQLHNYLHPMAAWFKELKEGNLSQCQSTTLALKEHLEKYDSYFK
jgi:hypothetical protein